MPIAGVYAGFQDEMPFCSNEGTTFARYADKYVVAAICATCLEDLYRGQVSHFESDVIRAALDDGCMLDRPGSTVPDWH